MLNRVAFWLIELVGAALDKAGVGYLADFDGDLDED